MTSTATERRQDIGKTIQEAMGKLDLDWTRESESITSAQAELDEAMMKFVEGAVSRAEVKAAYRAWVNAHRGGLF